MLKALCALAVLVAVAAATESPALPVAALESFLESGAHTEAEIDAMARSEVEAMLGDALDSEMPRDTKMQKEHEKKVARAVARAAATAAGAPVPPPVGAAVVGGSIVRPAARPVAPAPAVAGAATAAAVSSSVAGAAVPSGDRDDIIKLVYDELQRLGTTAAVPTTGSAPSLGVTDPRINTLEHRLSAFEKLRVEQANQMQDKAIAAITARLEGLDKTLTALRKSAQQQQALSSQLLRANSQKQPKKAVKDKDIDYSVSYSKAQLPADFDKKVQQILNSVKTEARKIYERYCKRAGINPNPTPAPKKQFKKAAAAQALSDAEKLKAKILNRASNKILNRARNTGAADAAPAPAAAEDKSGAILVSPIITGKEPTPEGMRLAKALNDIAQALPVTPAYQMGKEEQALHDVLGEGAVSNKWKTPRL